MLSSLLTLKYVISLAGLLLIAVRLLGGIRTTWSPKDRGGRAPSVPSRLPFGIDTIVNLLRAQKQGCIHEHWQDLLRRYDIHGRDTLELQALGQRMIYTSNPENIKTILATKFSDFGKGPVFRRNWEEFLGSSVFTTDGHEWHDHRQLIRPQFNRERVSDLRCFERHTRVLADVLAHRGPIDLYMCFTRLTLDVATDFLFGRPAGSLKTPQNDFAAAFDDVLEAQALIARAGALGRFMPRRRYREGIKTLDNALEAYIRQALETPAETLEAMEKTDEGFTFLHSLAKVTRDRKVIRDQLMSLLLAARDTTAVTLTWMFYELAQNPQILAKLRSEILKTLGTERAPSYEDLKNLKYLQHTVSETLRLYPSVPFSVRYCLRPSSLPDGGQLAGGSKIEDDGKRPIHVQPGTIVMYSPLLLHRNPKYHPDSSSSPSSKSTNTTAPLDIFQPERWDAWSPRPWHYIPFNGGPRICIGQNFALTQAAYVAVRLLQKFSKLDLDRMSQRALSQHKMISTIVLQPASPVLCSFLEEEDKLKTRGSYFEQETLVRYRMT